MDEAAVRTKTKAGEDQDLDRRDQKAVKAGLSEEDRQESDPGMDLRDEGRGEDRGEVLEEDDQSREQGETLDDLAERSGFSKGDGQESRAEEAGPNPYRDDFEREEETTGFRRINRDSVNRQSVYSGFRSKAEDHGRPFSSYNSGFGNRDDGYRQSTNRGSKVYLFILGLVGLAVLAGAVYLIKNQLKPGPDSQSAPAPQVNIVESSPLPTSIPLALDRSKYAVRVLNGTDTTGLAASVSGKLKDLGYRIDKIGNATNSAFSRTQIRVKAGDNVLANQLIKDLSYRFVAASSSAHLSPEDGADVEVVIGAK